MRIACPACVAAYDVPDRLLAGPARTLRCSRCGTDFALPQVEAAATPIIAEPETPAPEPPTPPPAAATRPEPLAPMLRPEAPAAPPAGLAWAWAASIAVVLAAVGALLVFHARVMEAWPASTRLFAALGLG